MSRSNKSKIAVTLLSTLAFGANGASAMNSGIKKSVSAPKSNFSASKDTKLGSGNGIAKMNGSNKFIEH